MPAYWIAHVEVTDPEPLRRVRPPRHRGDRGHGGRFLARAGAYKQLEGNDRARNVVVEFPDLADRRGLLQLAPRTRRR